MVGGLREQVQAEAQEPVGAQLQEHAGEDHRTGRGRLGVGIGQPGVQREDRHLHGEGECEREEHPAGGLDAEALRLGDGDQVECDRPAGGIGVQERQGQDADEHQRRTGHREQEKLGGGIGAVVVPPAADEEVHRHEHGLEAQEEHDQVEAGEHAHDAALEDQQPGVVGAAVVFRVGGQDGDREQDPRQDDEEQRDSVDSEQPRHTEVSEPDVAAGELEAVDSGVEGEQQPQRERSGRHRGEHGHQLQQLRAAAGHDDDQQGTEQRHDDQRREQREGGRGGGEHGGHQLALERNHSSRATAPMAAPAA